MNIASEPSEQSDTAPVREPVEARCASVGGRAEECRSDERNALQLGQLRRLRGVSLSATNDSARDVRAADLQEELVKPCS